MKDLSFSQIKQICKIIGCDPTDLPRELDDNWSLLDDEEANERCTEYIKDSCVYFNAWFLAEATGMPEKVFWALQAEDDNEACAEVIERTCGWTQFIGDAVSADGRGHFMSSYDGVEHEIKGDLYLYRHN